MPSLSPLHPPRRPRSVRRLRGHLLARAAAAVLADIYRARPAVVRLDGKKFRATDEADARKHAADLFEAFGLGLQTGGTDWYEQQHRTWVNLATLYAPIARWGKALFAERADVDALFPDLRGASRAAWGSVSRTASDDEKKPADPPATPTG